MPNSIKLSVIIALYNNKEHIQKTIMSVVNSNLKLEDYEIIVINDGSTDGGEVVVEALSKHYKNIILLNKKNGGQSSARNIGFKNAKGQYILCLDSDDFIVSEFLSSELNFIIDNDLDLCAYSFVKWKEDKSTVAHAYPKSVKPINGADFINNYIVLGAMCMYFYKAEIINNNNLTLIEGVYLEDEEFVLKFMLFCERIMCTQTPFYNYVFHSSSSTNNSSFHHRVRLIHDLVKVTISVDSLKLKLSSPKLIDGVNRKKEQLTMAILLNIFKFSLPSSEVNYIIKLLKDNNLYPLKIKLNSLKYKISSLFLNNEPLLRILLYLNRKWIMYSSKE